MADYDQYKMQNPVTQYSKDGFSKQQQNPPGLQTDMTPVPDCGEKSYRGSARLEGRKALVTGANSDIGRAAAIAFAREGADVALTYHPSEHKDAEQVAELVKEAGRKVVLLTGDLRDESVNVKVVEDALNQLGGLDILALVAGKQTAVEDIADLTTE